MMKFGILLLAALILGASSRGAPRLRPAAATDLLETLRLKGSYVDVRRGPDPDVFDWIPK